MTKPKSRTISELIKSRPKRSFGRESIDLLSEGEKIMALNSQTLPSTKLQTSDQESNLSEGGPPPVFKKDQQKSKKDQHIAVAYDPHKFLKESPPLTADYKNYKASAATKSTYSLALKELQQLKSEREHTISIDSYIIDNLFRELKSPMMSIVYIYLWRRTVGQGHPSVHLSIQVLSEAIGISKRTVQDTLKKLNELKLIHSTKVSATYVSEHQVLQPWKV